MPLSKEALVVKNNTNFPNNNSGYITPALLREFNTDMIDAMQLTQSMSEYAVLSGSNTFIGNQTIQGNLNVNGVISASILYVQTETASVIYSSGSNQFGDELSDIQTLSGSVKVQGSLTVNGTAVLTSSAAVTGFVTTSSFNAYTSSNNQRVSSLETNSASVNISIANINTTTASLNTSITNINSFTASQLVLNGTYATTGSNTFTGNQVIDRAYKLYTNGIYWTDVTAGFNNLEIINQGGGNLDFASLNGGTMRIVSTPLILTGSALYSSNDISTSANIYGANLTASAIPAGTISSSAQISALGFVSSSVTASSLVTASFSGNTLTFTKGDSSTFGVVIPDVSGSTINTGSFATTASFNAYTQSNDQRVTSLEVNSASVNTSIANINTTTASLNSSVTQLNASSASQQVSIDNLNAATSSYVTESETASFARTNVDNNFSANQTFTNITATSASITYLTTLYETASVIYSSGSNQLGDELTDIQTLSGSVKVQGSLTINGTPVLTSSVDISGLVTTASFNAYTSSNDQKVDSLIAATGSYATTGSNSFVGNQTITGSLFVSSSAQYDVVIEGQMIISSSTSGSTNGARLLISGAAAIGSSGNRTSQVLIQPQSVTLSRAGASGPTSVGFNSNGGITTSGPTSFVTANVNTGSNYAQLEASYYNTSTGDVNAFNAAANGSGIYLRDWDNTAFDYSPFMSIAPNDGVTIPIPQFTRGLSISGSGGLQVTGSLNVSGSANFVGGDVNFTDQGRNINIDVDRTIIKGQKAVLISQSLDIQNTLTASLQEGYVWAGGAGNISTLVATSSFGTAIDTGSFVTTSSFNAYTSSTNSRLTNIEATTASLNTSVSNLNTATSSLFTSASLTLTTASVTLNTITFTKGDASTFALTVDTGSGGGGSTDTGSLMVTGSIAGNILTFTKGDASTFNLTIPSATGSVFDTGSFATTGSNSFNGDQNVTGSVRAGTFIVGTIPQAPTIQSLDSGTPEGNTSLQVNAGASGSFSLRTLYGAGVGKALMEAYDTFPSYTSFAKFEAQSAGGININGSGQVSITGSSTIIQGFTYPTTDGTSGQVLTTNGSKVLTFTTVATGSGGGTTYENPTLNPYSGSLILVANTFTSSSFAHISASANGQVNLVFKNNNNTADTILSGSGNIFTNANNPTAGFKRYIGGSGNIMLAGGNVPQISGSMAFSPTINNNYFGGNSTTLTMRGPVSLNSGTWQITGNTINGTINLGQSPLNNAEKAVEGLTIDNNNINGNLTFIARRALHTQGNSIQNNLITSTTLTAASSSIIYASNIGGINITNSASGSGDAITLGANAVYAYGNLFAGVGNTITATGGSDPGDTDAYSYLRHIDQNQILGSSNGVNLPYAETGSNSLYATMIAGYGLGVTGSNTNVYTGLPANQGSAFFGRWNAQDGNRAQSAQTVFAVGTGDETTRKTGFLIDSGSNTYVEGTFNVSGSTTLSGSLYIQSGSTLPSATGSSILTWNPTTGQVSQSPIATLISSSFSVGAFNSTVTQSGSAAVSQSMTYNNTDISNGVSIVSNSQITLANTGTYNIQFSAQVLAATGQDDVYIWLKKNGTNVSNTATKLVLANNEADVAAWNFVITAAASDYFELAWQSRDGHTLLSAATATGNIPGIPSIILTVTQVE